MTVRVIYENGVFRPLEAVRLPEHAMGEVFMTSPKELPPACSGKDFLDAIESLPGLPPEVWDTFERAIDRHCGAGSEPRFVPTSALAPFVGIMPGEEGERFQALVEEASERIDAELPDRSVTR